MLDHQNNNSISRTRLQFSTTKTQIKNLRCETMLDIQNNNPYETIRYKAQGMLRLHYMTRNRTCWDISRMGTRSVGKIKGPITLDQP